MLFDSCHAFLLLLLLHLFPLHINGNQQETLIGIVGRDFVVLGADSSIAQSLAVTLTRLDKICIVSPSSCSTPLVVAAAGDAADSDRLLGLLSAHCAIHYYEATSHGNDVECIRLDNTNDDNGIVVVQEEQDGGLTVKQVAHLARHQISSSLRSASQLNVNLLIAGMMKQDSDDDADVLERVGSFSQRLQDQVQQATKTIKDDTNSVDSGGTNIAAAEASSAPSSLSPRLYWLDPYGSIQRMHQYGAHGLGANFILSVLDQGYRPNLSQEDAIQLIQECFQELQKRYVINTANAQSPPCIKCIDKDGCRLIL